ncbi:HD domain-containing protein [bacterium]|nr:HD domain-containing protein [bacterium]
MSTIDEIQKLFDERGDSQYGFEAVSQREHALQAAALAEHDGASPALITAALLHDVGHLLHNLPDDATEKGIDDQHEELGQRWLERYFGRDVWEPVLLHVAAKRYLCQIEPDYEATLSRPSRQSLALQGGVMSVEDASEFVAHKFADDAVRLRRWDDAAKAAGLETPSIEHFLQFVAACCLDRTEADCE